MSRLPLQGIRVADFSWVGAGPFATKPLADHGADVIKIESASRPDMTRLSPPFAQNVPGINRSGYFSNRNSSKRSISLNLKTPEGVEIAKRLIMASDVVVNNFTPGTMAKWGLGYPEVAAMKPTIIYLEMPMQGNAGPRRDYGGFGASISALSGLHGLSGDPDKLPVGTGTNYPDHVPNPAHAAIAVLAALHRRRKTGQGQYIELAQFESTVTVIGTALMQYMVNRKVVERQGNRNGYDAPRAVLRCAGTDRWCTVSVRTHQEWVALCSAVGHPEWLEDPHFKELEQRLQHQDELEAALAEWTGQRDPYEVMACLQAAGVPSGVVQTAADVVDRDPSLRERHWQYLDHPEMGRSLYDAPPIQLSRTPGQLRRPAPQLGQHTREVLHGVLGLTEAEIDRYQQAGALS